MPEDERGALVRRHGNKEEAHAAYLNNRVASEIEPRDPSWYAGDEHKGITFTGDVVRRDKAKKWRVDPREENRREAGGSGLQD